MYVNTNIITELKENELLTIDGGDFLGDLAYNVGFVAGVVTVSGLEAFKKACEAVIG